MPLQKKIDGLFLIAIFIFAGLFYVVFQGARVTRESSQLVSQAHEILYVLERVESAISGIEGAHRGFVITGRGEFLGTLGNEKKEISNNLKLLGSLMGDNQEQSNRLEVLSHLINKKIVFSEQGIAIRKQGNKEEALEMVSSGKGKLLMDSIRTVCNVLEREEINALNEKSTANKDLVVTQTRNYLLFSGFILLALFVLYLRIRNNTRRLMVYQKKQEDLIKELNYQNKQLDDFAHLTSHNIRSPAVNIYSLISLLDENSSLQDYQNICAKLSKVSNNLNETLNELLEVLQVKSNTTIERNHLHFDNIFTKVKDSMQGDILLSRAVISSSFQEAPAIHYPKPYLESIFYNLLSNAIKYRSPERAPEIHVSTYLVNGKTVLSVTDNGLGIDMKRYGSQVFGLRKIFHTTVNAKGIGLFMTKTQVEALGGGISIQSEVDKGTTFSVDFDIKKNDAAPHRTKMTHNLSRQVFNLP